METEKKIPYDQYLTSRDAIFVILVPALSMTIFTHRSIAKSVFCDSQPEKKRSDRAKNASAVSVMEFLSNVNFSPTPNQRPNHDVCNRESMKLKRTHLQVVLP